MTYTEADLDAARRGEWVQGWWDAVARTVAVDFDGVIHPYTKGWTGSEPDDEPPTPGAVEFLEQLLADGYDVVIFSTRADHPLGRLGILNWLGNYAPNVYKHLGGWEGKTLLVTHEKPAAVAYVDDRAVVFRPAEGHGWTEAREAIDKLASGRPHGSGQPADPPPGA